MDNENSSVKNISKCQNKVHKGIETIETIIRFEAFYIRKYKPTLNSRKCSEFADLLFEWIFCHIWKDSLSIDTRLWDHFYLYAHKTLAHKIILSVFIHICTLLFIIYFSPGILLLFTRFHSTVVFKPYAEIFSHPWWCRGSAKAWILKKIKDNINFIVI